MVEHGWCLQIKNGCHGYKCTLQHCYHSGVGGGEPQTRHAPKQQRLGYQWERTLHYYVCITGRVFNFLHRNVWLMCSVNPYMFNA